MYRYGRLENAPVCCKTKGIKGKCTLPDVDALTLCSRGEKAMSFWMHFCGSPKYIDNQSRNTPAMLAPVKRPLHVGTGLFVSLSEPNKNIWNLDYIADLHRRHSAILHRISNQKDLLQEHLLCSKSCGC